MNYRHAFHAGSFADVVKHAALARILVHLAGKPAAFRVIDTHAGAGLYDLTGPEAGRSGEWRGGIARVLAAPMAAPVRALLAPYLDVITALNGGEGGGGGREGSGGDGGALTAYPGSPALARALMRPQDRLIACELEPNAATALARHLARDRRVKTVSIDGWVALNAYVPPVERRGVVVIDPPFEDADDFTRLAHGLEAAHRKWAGGIYLLWYPIKGRQEPDALARRLKRSGISKILRAELVVGPTPVEGRLGGCGLIVVNPPFTLEDELAAILPELSATLAGRGGGHRLDWIAAEAGNSRGVSN